MLADSLIISQLTYTLPVWGPSLKANLCSYRHHLYNCAARVVCGLQKYDHVSNGRCTLGWFSLDNPIKHCVINSMYCHYVSSDCVVFINNSPIEFGSNHSYDTQIQSYFCQVSHCKTSFGQWFFRSRVTDW